MASVAEAAEGCQRRHEPGRWRKDTRRGNEPGAAAMALGGCACRPPHAQRVGWVNWSFERAGRGGLKARCCRAEALFGRKTRVLRTESEQTGPGIAVSRRLTWSGTEGRSAVLCIAVTGRDVARCRRLSCPWPDKESWRCTAQLFLFIFRPNLLLRRD